MKTGARSFRRASRSPLLVLAAVIGLHLGLLFAGCTGCTGTGVKASCTLNADGTRSCSVEVHREGDHAK